jgi:hypothetical protein
VRIVTQAIAVSAIAPIDVMVRIGERSIERPVVIWVPGDRTRKLLWQ